MMAYSDPLSIAVSVIDAFFTETGIDRKTWLEVDIFRLLTGGGWLVSATQTAILLDEWTAVAA